MPGGITLKESAPVDIPAPDSGKDTIFIDNTAVPIPVPSYKDSSGVVHTLLGSKGDKGDTGALVLGLDGNDGEDAVAIPGNQGATGLQGIQGAKGDTGALVIGIDGDEGESFPIIGPKGNQGIQGITGAQGPLGPTILVMDGEDGEDGLPGQSAIFPPILTIASASAPATLQISTEGTIDWFYAGVTTLPRAISIGSLHSKQAGGAIALSFDWILASGTLSTFGSAVPAVTSTASDDSTGAALSSAATGVDVGKAAGSGQGWRFRVPASPSTTRILRIYAGAFSGNITVTAAMVGATSVNASFDPGAGASGTKVWTITFRGEGDLSVTGILTSNEGSTPNITFVCATVALS